MRIVPSILRKMPLMSRAVRRVLSTPRWIRWGGLALLLIGASLRLPGLLAQDVQHPSAAGGVVSSQRVLPVDSTVVTAAHSYQVLRAYTGVVAARQSSALGFERAGTLVTLTVEAGTRVAQGELLAMLDTQTLHARRQDLLAQQTHAHARLAELRAGPRPQTIAAARAQLRELQAALVLAQRRHKSRQALLDKGFIAREGVDEVSTDMHITQARLDAAQQRLEELLAGTRREQVQAQEALLKQIDARLHALDVELQHSQLKAPFAGTIVERLAAVGTVVSPEQPVLRLLEDTNLEARVGVPPDVAATLMLGSVQSLQVGRTVLKAQVSALVPELDSATRTVMVVLHLPRRLVSIVLAGQVARLHLTETVESAGFWLPITALSKGPHGLWSCFVLVPAGGTEPSLFRTEYRSLEVLYTANERVFVRGLLQEGDRIVSSGVHRLVAAQLVRPAA